MKRASDHTLLEQVRDLPLTYRGSGATAAASTMPDGYRHIDRTVTIGSGSDVYERACAGLLSWQMHRRAGIRVVASGPRAVTGACVVLLIGRHPLAVSAPCRVVYTISTDRSQGFAYGTLPGHPEAGEEAFILTHGTDGRVRFRVRAFSRPATRLARAGGPLTLLAQKLATDRYFRALRSIARQHASA